MTYRVEKNHLLAARVKCIIIIIMVGEMRENAAYLLQ